MGTLIGMAYPTKPFFKLADHTYVKCGGGGKAWSCWGGKTGGKEIARGPGSTVRANAIAQPNEKANITCYLVNGVCHQAANRILFPAGVLVTKAKGYWVSEALFGPYGRMSAAFGLCKAPFYKHSGLTGDLPGCTAAKGMENASDAEGAEASPELRSYAREMAALYDSARPMLRAETGNTEDIRSFQMTLFERMVDFKLEAGPEADRRAALMEPRLEVERQREKYEAAFSNGEMTAEEFVEKINNLPTLFERMVDYTLEAGLEADRRGALMERRLEVERQREEYEAAFFNGEMKVEEFVEKMNDLTIRFQRQAAEILPPPSFVRLLEVSPEEPVVVGDPEIAQAAYADR